MTEPPPTTGTTTGGSTTCGSTGGGGGWTPEVHARIVSANFNNYASGTKCEFEWEVEIDDEGIPEGQSAYLDWAYCKIADEQLPDATMGDDLVLMQGVRFASNHFTEGVKNVVVHAHVTVRDSATGTIISQHQFASQNWPIGVYNKVGFIANRMQNGGGEPDPDLPPSSAGPTIPYSTKRIAKTAIEITFAPGAGAINYGLFQTVAENARTVRQPEVLSNILAGTALVYGTHANYDNFNDAYSYSENGYTPPPGFPPENGFGNISTGYLIFPDEITPKIQAKNAVSPPLPPVNLVLMWACEVLKLPSNPELGVNPRMASRFLVHDSPDRALTGFQHTVLGGLKAGEEFSGVTFEANPNLPNPIPDPLHYHADALLARLKAGDTIEEAVDYANKHYMPRRYTPSGWAPHPMMPVGDFFYRLKNVYANANDQAAFPQWRTSWFLMFY